MGAPRGGCREASPTPPRAAGGCAGPGAGIELRPQGTRGSGPGPRQGGGTPYPGAHERTLHPSGRAGAHFPLVRAAARRPARCWVTGCDRTMPAAGREGGPHPAGAASGGDPGSPRGVKSRHPGTPAPRVRSPRGRTQGQRQRQRQERGRAGTGACEGRRPETVPRRLPSRPAGATDPLPGLSTARPPFPPGQPPPRKGPVAQAAPGTRWGGSGDRAAAGPGSSPVRARAPPAAGTGRHVRRPALRPAPPAGGHGHPELPAPGRAAGRSGRRPPHPEGQRHAVPRGLSSDVT